MNRKGHPPTLVPRQPENFNALKSGAHSPRLIAARAAEIVAEFGIAETLDEAGRVVLNEVARLTALVEAIDCDLEQRGFVDRRGKERYLLQLRERYSRRLLEAHDRLVDAQRRAAKSSVQAAVQDTTGKPSDYVRQLQVIALSRDPDGRVADRLIALRLLLELGERGSTSYYETSAPSVPYSDDEVFQRRVGEKQRELEGARKEGYLAQLQNEIDLARFTG